jgi:hypothetical protein
MFTGLRAHQERREAWDAACATAYRELRAQFVTALFSDITTELPTAAFRPKSNTCAAVVLDQLDDSAGGVLECLTRLVVACAQGEDPATRLPASALIERMAHAYADTHAADQAIADAEQ